MALIIKNTTGSSILHTASGLSFPQNSSTEVSSSDQVKLLDQQMLDLIVAGSLLVNDGTADITDHASAWNAVQGLFAKVEISKQTESKPFAEPTHRTKRHAVASAVTCAPDSYENVDFQLTEERYVSGGVLVAKNWEFGDWITAEIHDKDAVIPEAYRAATCEAWPTVASYIIREYVEPHSIAGYGRAFIDTRPLAAKVTAGLYLRVVYNAAATGSSRLVIVNYHLSKKLT
jgi:hypothetical protein